MTIYILGFTAVMGVVYLLHSAAKFKSETGKRALTKSLLNRRLDDEMAIESFLVRHRWSQHRSTFLNFGLVFALGFASLAFEYTSTGKIEVSRSPLEVEELIEIPVIRTPSVQPKELPKPELTKVFDIRSEILLVDEPQPDPIEFLDEVEPVLAKAQLVDFVAPVPPPPAPKPEIRPEENLPDYVDVAENMPHFNSCEELEDDKKALELCAQQAMLSFLYDKIRYPTIARENCVQGTAVISFIVERDGSISDAKIVRDPGAGTGTEALRVVKSMPAWVPGSQNGRKVRVKFNLPIKFKLNDC